MNIDFKHEIKNLVISSVAMAMIVLIFVVALSTGALYQLARLTDSIRIQLGLIPEHILPKLVGGYAYSIVPVNITIFIIINLVCGFSAFRIISKRGTKYPGWIFGISMTLIFFLISSILTILSGDPFNWLAVIYGVPVTLFIQVLLATYSVTRNNNKASLH
ncbi:MAG: hypothetical protein JL50_10435 [Peptococcaceae bacterium BICA1-7]|nr:MAG: hypothetical protein JL50_10435 [Peptococcaceae bacterium BICA1-7]HBV95700.1 hypothetical protein [Desulfotomaculum sp.]